MFVIKFHGMNCWIAPWEGDPGRTMVFESAKKYKDLTSAENAREKIIKENQHRQMTLVICSLD